MVLGELAHSPARFIYSYLKIKKKKLYLENDWFQPRRKCLAFSFLLNNILINDLEEDKGVMKDPSWEETYIRWQSQKFNRLECWAEI